MHINIGQLSKEYWKLFSRTFEVSCPRSTLSPPQTALDRSFRELPIIRKARRKSLDVLTIYLRR